MGVGLFLRGEPCDGVLGLIVERLRREPCLSSLRVDDEAVEVVLHPAAESVDFVLEAGGALRVTTKTSTVGPGYHAYVADMLRALGDELGIGWTEVEDDTGYFSTGDFVAVEREMLAWIAGVTGLVLRKGASGLLLSLPPTHGYVFDGALGTPLGPRDLAWVSSVATGGGGADLFPWWRRGMGAEMRLGRALCRMWTDVRWRASISVDEDALRAAILADLAAAYAENPGLDYPWREWLELRAVTANATLPSVVSARAALATGPLVGYRRRPARVHLPGGWSLELPGELAERQDDDGSFVAWDAHRTLEFSAFRQAGTVDELLASDGEFDRDASSELVGARVRSRARMETDGSLRRLSVRAARLDGGRVAVASLSWLDGDGAWAERIRESIDHHG